MPKSRHKRKPKPKKFAPPPKKAHIPFTIAGSKQFIEDVKNILEEEAKNYTTKYHDK